MPDNPQVAASKSESRKDTGSTETALGLEFAQLDDRARQRYGIEEGVQGVVVASVSADSPVADTGISPGDVIVSVEQRAVNSPAEIVERIEKIGSASGRERGCQYVEISVVAVSLKKTTQKTKTQ